MNNFLTLDTSACAGVFFYLIARPYSPQATGTKKATRGPLFRNYGLM